MENEEDNYQDGEELEETFSILNILKNEIEKESMIQDLKNLIFFFYNQSNTNNKDYNKELIKLFNMVLELLNGIYAPLESLVNDQMIPNLFEFYQISDELRYYFALFNGDIKMKLNNIIKSNEYSTTINIFNNKDNINYKSFILNSFLNNNNNNDNNKIIQLFNNNRNQINNQIMKILNNENNKESIKNEIENELNKSQEINKEKEVSENIDEKELIEKSFFIIFQLFTSFIYSLQSLCEKLLLSINEFEKKNLFNQLVEKDLITLNSIIQLLNITINSSEKVSNQDEYLEKIFEKIQIRNTIDIQKNQNDSLLNSIQSLFLKYIEKNNIDESSILEFLNNQ